MCVDELKTIIIVFGGPVRLTAGSERCWGGTEYCLDENDDPSSMEETVAENA